MALRKSALFILFFLLLFILAAEEAVTTFSLSGEITFKKNHDIIVEIVSKEQYDTNSTSPIAITLVMTDEIRKAKKVAFRITGIPSGTYVVKVFQDLNGNGLYNWKLIGGEPIATYKAPTGVVLGKPSFEKLSFELTEDLKDVVIELP